MQPTPQLPQRPQPSRSAVRSVQAWVQWFGLPRIVVCALSVVAVGAGAFWLLRAPVAPIEDSLPFASRASSTTTAGASTTPGGGSVAVDGSAATSTNTAVGAAPVVVYVTGAVVTPSVVTLPGSARVDDAIGAAGGLAPDADLETVNLAALLRDGDRVYVPHAGLPVPTVLAPSGGVAPATGTGGGSVPTGPVDLNRATTEQLDELPGVGPSTAAAIVTYREQKGPFASVDDLLRVPGIGPAKLDAIRALVTV